MERVAGIEPAYTAWKAVVIAIIPYPLRMVVGGGFEPPKLTRQIYSLIPLATREPLRKAAYCPDGQALCQPILPIKLSTYTSFVSRRGDRHAYCAPNTEN